jgi:hypothetical protein
MAPEWFMEAEYSKKVDIYAFVLILYEIVVGAPVWPEGLSPYQLMMKVAVRGERYWTQEPSDRPTFAEVFDLLASHDFALLPGVPSAEIREYRKWVDIQQRVQ